MSFGQCTAALRLLLLAQFLTPKSNWNLWFTGTMLHDRVYNKTVSMNGVCVCMLHTNTDIRRSIKLTFALMRVKKEIFHFFLKITLTLSKIVWESNYGDSVWNFYIGIHLNIRISINSMKIKLELMYKRKKL